MGIRSLLLACSLALLAPLPAMAQQVCDLMPEPRAREATRLAAPDGERIYIRGPARFECTGGVTVRADSAVSYSGRGELHLVGHVFYGDSIKTLTADWVNYLGRDGRLFARGSVVLTDRESASVIRGRELEYHAATDQRPETRTIVRGDPTAILYPSSGTRPAAPRPGRPAAADRDPAEPFHVDANRMEILAERHFHADGDVVLRRGDTRGWARDAVFDQDHELLVLTDDARILDEQFELTGAKIRAFLDGDALREVEAEDEAVLLAEDLRVDATMLRIFFAEGDLDRLVARGQPVAVASGDDEDAGSAPERIGVARSGAPLMRALVSAPDFRLEADSIDAYLPNQLLDRVIAVGSAFGERLGDTIDDGLPPLLERDWLRGDTITGYFVPAAQTAEDEDIEVEVDGDRATSQDQAQSQPELVEEPDEGDRVVLERLVAAAADGGQARALYRMRDDGDEERPAANYLVAVRITLWLLDGQVQEMEADGPIRGIYIDPVKTNDTTETPVTARGPRGRQR